MITRYITGRIIKRVYERKHYEYISGLGEDALFSERSEGWAIELEGPNPMTLLVEEQPKAEPGQVMKVTYEILDDTSKR